VAWTTFASQYLVEFTKGVNSGEQVKYVLTQPFMFVLTLYKTLSIQSVRWISELTGYNMSSASVCAMEVLRIVFDIILLLAILVNDNKISGNEEKKVDNKTKIIVFFSIILVFALIIASLYVQWTAYKNDQIIGIQGRYFIPILILLPLLFENEFIVLNKEIDLKYLLLFISILNIHILSLVMITHV
jgi:uncharacterized membrane protein